MHQKLHNIKSPFHDWKKPNQKLKSINCENNRNTEILIVIKLPSKYDFRYIISRTLDRNDKP